MERNILLTVLFSLMLSAISGIRISESKCDEYRNWPSLIPTKAFDDDAAPKEFPFMARIGDGVHHRNGILISENYVLSTAFSTLDFSSAKIFVVLGDLEVETNTDDARPRTYAITEPIIHPNFNPFDQSSNLQLLRLNESVTFDEYVRPACLSSNTFSMPQQLMEIGWGVTNVRSSKRLHKIKLNHISKESCKRNRSIDQIKYIRYIDSETIFCAEPKKYDRMLCDGFAGSAVINAFDEIVGIASASFGCDYHVKNLHIFVRVAAYIDWIEGIVWPDEETSTATIRNELELTTEQWPDEETSTATIRNELELTTEQWPDEETSTATIRNEFELTTEQWPDEETSTATIRNELELTTEQWPDEETSTATIRNEFELTTEQELATPTQSSSRIDVETTIFESEERKSTSLSTTITSITTIQPSFENKSFASKYVIEIIVAATVTVLVLSFALILCFKVMCRSMSRQDPVIVLLDRGNERIWLNSQTISIK